MRLLNGNRILDLRYYQRNPGEVWKRQSQKVRIWSNEHGAYWRPKGQGYTAGRDGAGVFQFAEAYALTRHCGPEKRIYFELVRVGDTGQAARPESEWHEDYGDVMWWKFPIREAPWVGSPLGDNWPGYHTHWTPLPPLPHMPPRRRPHA